VLFTIAMVVRLNRKTVVAGTSLLRYSNFSAGFPCFSRSSQSSFGSDGSTHCVFQYEAVSLNLLNSKYRVGLIIQRILDLPGRLGTTLDRVLHSVLVRDFPMPRETTRVDRPFSIPGGAGKSIVQTNTKVLRETRRSVRELLDSLEDNAIDDAALGTPV